MTKAWDGEANSRASTRGPKTTPIAISTTSILARIMREGVSGAVATRSAASSPEIVSHARPPANWPAAITMTADQHERQRGVGETAPQHHRGRHEIQHCITVPTQARDRAAAGIPCGAAPAAATLHGTVLTWSPRTFARLAALGGRAHRYLGGKRGDNVAMTAPSKLRRKQTQQGPISPTAARAGHHRTLSALGAKAAAASGCQNREPRQRAVRQDSRICNAITKPAPITAATI